MRTAGIAAIVVLCGCGGDGRSDAESTSGSDTASSTVTTAADETSSTGRAETTANAEAETTTGGDAHAACFHTWTFEDCADDWEVGVVDAAAPGVPSWECGAMASEFDFADAHPGVWATALGGEYGEDESSYLASPSFSLAECAGATVYLRFAHLYEFGAGDGGLVQISVDGGASWTTLVPSWHGYCAAPLAVPWNPPGGEPGFCGGNDEVWMHSLVPLDDYAGEPDVRVRFVFGSDGIIEQFGWYIDSMATEAY